MLSTQWHILPINGLYYQMIQKKDGFKGQINIVLPDEIVKISAGNPLTSSLYITDIGFYPRAKFHYRDRSGGIDQNILIYVREGEGIINVQNTRYRMRSGDCYIIPANAPHIYRAELDDPWSIYWIHFKGAKAGLFAQKVQTPVNIPEPDDPGKAEQVRLFQEIIANLSMGYSYENLEYSNICLWQLLASFTHLKSFRTFSRTNVNDPVQIAIKFMKSNIDKDISLKMLADHTGYSVSHFSRIFSDSTHASPIDYLIQLKIQHACQLLDFSRLNIAEIAQRTGYADPYYFSRIFKKIMGISPLKYRTRKT